jgi:hypothetical protein
MFFRIKLENKTDSNLLQFELSNFIVNSLTNIIVKQLIYNDFFIKDYFYYKTIFIKVQDKTWMGLRITEYNLNYSKVKIYKANVFEDSVLKYTSFNILVPDYKQYQFTSLTKLK